MSILHRIPPSPLLLSQPAPASRLATYYFPRPILNDETIVGDVMEFIVLIGDSENLKEEYQFHEYPRLASTVRDFIQYPHALPMYYFLRNIEMVFLLMSYLVMHMEIQLAKNGVSEPHIEPMLSRGRKKMIKVIKAFMLHRWNLPKEELHFIVYGDVFPKDHDFFMLSYDMRLPVIAAEQYATARSEALQRGRIRYYDLFPARLASTPGDTIDNPLDVDTFELLGADPLAEMGDVEESMEGETFDV
jgi:hypothetical protein